MGIVRLQTSFGRIFSQRCFYLFVSLVALLAVAPFVTDTSEGRLVVSVTHAFVLVAAVAAVGRTAVPFVIALLLVLPTLGFRVMVMLGMEEPDHGLQISSAFMLAFYIVTLIYLLRYVFSPDVMTDDKLFGAAAAYLMLGIAWALAYDIAQRLDPAAFGIQPGQAHRSFYDLLFMSVGYLTSNGPGEIALVGAKVRTLAILEQLFGTLYIAILVARLAGIYPARAKVGDN